MAHFLSRTYPPWSLDTLLGGGLVRFAEYHTVGAPITGTTTPDCRSLIRGGRTDSAPLTMFNAAKDALTSRSAQVWANNLIARYGKVQALKIDSRLKTLEVTCLLDGES